MTAVVAVRPFGDADKLLLALGQKYKLGNLVHISVGLKVEHSGFGTLNNQMFGSKFVEEARHLRIGDKGDGQEGKNQAAHTETYQTIMLKY